MRSLLCLVSFALLFHLAATCCKVAKGAKECCGNGSCNKFCCNCDKGCNTEKCQGFTGRDAFDMDTQVADAKDGRDKRAVNETAPLNEYQKTAEATFRQADVDGDGFICAAEARQYLGIPADDRSNGTMPDASNSTTTTAKPPGWFNEMDKNGDGHIERKELDASLG